ncbi:exocyst complex component Sec3-domain-containing protein [Auriculariales sp. MPI-PUGE-AT-0066]|nr:exocyst complex component Sec3-domain-containing protein [Auriculariales sp. MPI-PUGE-AT-0066]
MADSASARQRMISSLFSQGGTRPDETYVVHLKIWEDTDGQAGQTGAKARFIIIASDSRGSALIHKSKENSNGTFSVGKTWKIEELRGFEVTAPTMLRASFARTYTWQTPSAQEQNTFIRSAVGVYRQVTGSSSALNLINCQDDYTTSVASTVPVNGSRNASVGRSTTPRGYDIPAASPSRLGTSGPRSGISPVDGHGRSTSVAREPSPRRDVRAPSPSPQVNGYPVNNSPLRTPAPLRSPSGDMVNASRPSPNNVTPLYSPQAPPRSAVVPERVVSPPPQRSSPGPRDTQSSFSTNYSDRASAYPQSGISERLPSARISERLSNEPPARRVEEPAPPRKQPSPQPPPVARQPSPAPVQTQPEQSSATSRNRTVKLPVARPSLPRLETAKPEPEARVETFDPANQSAADRLLTSNPAKSTSAREDDSVEATMSNVEEMLEGYEWASAGVLGARGSLGAADQIEARLTNELLALERANIHSFLETDDRITTVLKFIDEALEELGGMESQVTGYKIQLNAVSDDIGFIQGQNRGLQVQTQNQRLLLNELEKLLQTTHVDQDVLYALTQGSLSSGIDQLEAAAAQLYMALQSGRDNDMAAMIERLDEYRTHNSQFCTRLLDYLKIMFKAEASATTVTRDNNKGLGRSSLALLPHKSMYRGLMKYSKLVHYVKEMDQPKYAKICEVYILESAELHAKEIKELLMDCISRLKKAGDDDDENFATTPNAATSKTDILNELKPSDDGDLRVAEGFQAILEQIAPQIRHEQEFLSDFLHINDAGVTFADVMNLDSYFRRQAARGTELAPQTIKVVRNAVDAIFAFMWPELRDWIDGALQRDSHQIVGIMAALDRWINDVDSNDYFLSRMLQQKIQQRLRGQFQHQIGDQVKSIEQTRVTSKKRLGVAQFIKYFPVYVSRIETQLIGADGYETRSMVDAAYEKLVQSMLECLKTMAKIEGDGEDKGQLNYHVMLIENMFYFIHELSEQQLGAVRTFIRKAEDIYEENLAAYVKLVQRRPMGKLLDHFDGIERLLQTSGANAVAASANYNKSAAKRVLKDYNSKDMRKIIEALFKRVSKHFAENEDAAVFQPGTVEMSVWKACEEDMTRNTQRFTKLVTQCYADTGLGIEFSLSDIEQAFKKHRTG